MRTPFRFMLAFALLGWLAETPARAASPTPTEHQVKAAYMYNFAKFVNWPESSFPEPNAPLVLGVLDDDRFAAILDDTIRGQTIGNRSLTSKKYTPQTDEFDCHLLFIPASRKSTLPALLQSIRSQPTLVISDAEGFCLRGGMIQFVMEKGSVRFDINVEAIQAARLEVSAKLIKAARQVVKSTPAKPSGE